MEFLERRNAITEIKYRSRHTVPLTSGICEEVYHQAVKRQHRAAVEVMDRELQCWVPVPGSEMTTVDPCSRQLLRCSSVSFFVT